MLSNIQTDAALTSLPGPPMQMLTLWDDGRIMLIQATQATDERILGMKALGTVHQKPVHTIQVNFYYPNRRQ